TAFYLLSISFPTRRSSDLRRNCVLCLPHQFFSEFDSDSLTSLLVIDNALFRVVAVLAKDKPLHGYHSEDGIVYYQKTPQRVRVRSEEHTSELQSRENLVCR